MPGTAFLVDGFRQVRSARSGTPAVTLTVLQSPSTFGLPTGRLIVTLYRALQTTDKCKDYFLTHAHGDHTTGLSKGWSGGTIYCTRVTARLITEEAGIARHRVHAVDMDTPFVVAGVTVTALCANHCPGAPCAVCAGTCL